MIKIPVNPKRERMYLITESDKISKHSQKSANATSTYSLFHCEHLTTFSNS